MKKIFVITLLITALIGILVVNNVANAAKKSSKKSGLSVEEIQKLSDSVDGFTRKVYANSLFSPKEIQNLIDIKIKLDNQMIVAPDPSLAPLYFKIGNIFKSRNMKDEAVDCYQTVLENFADTAFAPKSIKMLSAMGVQVNLDDYKKSDDESEEE